MLSRKRKNNRVDSERGAALIITLWAALILCVIALDLAYSTRLELRTGSYHAQRLQARELSRAGLDLALAHLEDTANRQFDTTLRLENNEWKPADASSGPAGWNQFEIADAQGAPAGALAVEIVNESGKLDINSADRPTLERLLEFLGVENAQQVAGAILAYRDSRPDAALVCLDELRNIPGVDTTLIYGEDMNNNGLLDIGENDGGDNEPQDNRDGALSTGLAAHVTVSPIAAVSVNHASVPVLAAVLDISPEQAQLIAAFRDARESRILDLAELSALAGMNESFSEKVFSRLAVDASRYTVRVKATAVNGNAPVQADITVAVIDGKPAPVLWRAY